MPWVFSKLSLLWKTFLQTEPLWVVTHTAWAKHAHYAWIAKTYGLHSSHDALQVPNLLRVFASVCTPLPTRTQQLPTLLAQQCWELLRSFASSLGSPRLLKRPYLSCKFLLKKNYQGQLMKFGFTILLMNTSHE